MNTSNDVCMWIIYTLLSSNQYLLMPICIMYISNICIWNKLYWNEHEHWYSYRYCFLEINIFILKAKSRCDVQPKYVFFVTFTEHIKLIITSNIHQYFRKFVIIHTAALFLTFCSTFLCIRTTYFNQRSPNHTSNCR